MANELKEDTRCKECIHYRYTGPQTTGFCAKRKMATKYNAICSKFIC